MQAMEGHEKGFACELFLALSSLCIYLAGWPAFWVSWTLMSGWSPSTFIRTRIILSWKLPNTILTVNPLKSTSHAVTPWPNLTKQAHQAPSPSILCGPWWLKVPLHWVKRWPARLPNGSASPTVKTSFH